MLTTANESHNVNLTIVINAGTARNSEEIFEGSNYKLKDNSWHEK